MIGGANLPAGRDLVDSQPSRYPKSTITATRTASRIQTAGRLTVFNHSERRARIMSALACASQLQEHILQAALGRRQFPDAHAG